MEILYIINVISAFLTLIYAYYLFSIVNKYATKIRQEKDQGKKAEPLIKNKDFQKKAYILGILVLINIITAILQWGKGIL